MSPASHVVKAAMGRFAQLIRSKPCRPARAMQARKRFRAFEAALERTDYGEACAVALATSQPPRKISKQLLMILPKIREVDACLRSEPAAAPRVFERYSQLSYRSQSLTSKCLSAWPLWDQPALRPWTTCAW
jgi:predicted RNase H-like nuclease